MICLPYFRTLAWTDALILLIVAFYLYQVVRVPWELYYASRTRRIAESVASLSGSSESLVSEKIRRRRGAAAAELRNQELLALLLCVISPFLGSQLLYYVRGALSEPERYINPFNVRLFVLASGIKPWSHFVKLIKRRSLFLQSEVHYPVESVTLLQDQVQSLTEEIDHLKRSLASKTDVRHLRDGIDQPLTELSKAMRRYERKEEYMRLSNEEKFSILAGRQEEMLQEIAVSAQLIDALRVEQEKSGNILKKLRTVFGSGYVERKGGYVWYERGICFYIFLPVSRRSPTCKEYIAESIVLFCSSLQLIASTRLLDATGRLFSSISHQRTNLIENGSYTGKSYHYLSHTDAAPAKAKGGLAKHAVTPTGLITDSQPKMGIANMGFTGMVSGMNGR